MKTVFTTSEAAKVCRVSPQAILRMFDNGGLEGFRVPGSKFRRITLRGLYKLMVEMNCPTEMSAPFDPLFRVTVVGTEVDRYRRRLVANLGESESVRLDIDANAKTLETDLLFQPRAILVLGITRHELEQIELLRTRTNKDSIPIVIYCPGDCGIGVRALEAHGATKVFNGTTKLPTVIEYMMELAREWQETPEPPKKRKLKAPKIGTGKLK